MLELKKLKDAIKCPNEECHSILFFPRGHHTAQLAEAIIETGVCAACGLVLKRCVRCQGLDLIENFPIDDDEDFCLDCVAEEELDAYYDELEADAYRAMLEEEW